MNPMGNLPRRRGVLAGAAVTLGLGACGLAPVASVPPTEIVLAWDPADPVRPSPVAGTARWFLQPVVRLPAGWERESLSVPGPAPGTWRAAPGWRWREPPAEAVHRLLRRDLAIAAGPVWVEEGAASRGDGVRRLRVDIEAVEAGASGLRLVARVALWPASPGATPRVVRLEVDQPAEGLADPPRLAATWRSALARLAERVAALLASA